MDPVRGDAAVLSATLYVNVEDPELLVVFVNCDVGDVSDPNVIQLAILVAVHEVLGEPEIVTIVCAVSPWLAAFVSLEGFKLGADSIAMTREPRRTYSFEGKG